MRGRRTGSIDTDLYRKISDKDQIHLSIFFHAVK